VQQPSIDFDRRALLGALASIAGLACAPTLTTSRPASPLRVGAALARVPPGVRLVGRSYLELVPDEADRERLQERLHWPRSETELDDWHARLDQAVVADLEDDQLVDLGGWQLTRTECRVYGLAALLEE